MGLALGELAALCGATLRGDPAFVVERVAGLAAADEDALSFLADARYLKFLAQTRAGAVILAPEHAARCPAHALVAADPQLCYARAAAALCPLPPVPAGVHPTAVVSAAARVAADAWVGPQCVVGAGACIEARVYLGPGCIVGEQAHIGCDSRLVARVTVCERVCIGARALIFPGAVLGADGFGLARDGERWLRIPQLGTVRIGDDVEIGANTTIDRGAIEDTVIEDGVKLDNQIQIAHNVRIGAHTAIAGCTGIAGSARIGARCMIGGGVGIAGHLDIADDVQLTGMTFVTRGIASAGLYSSGMPAQSNSAWRRTIARLRRLDRWAQRLARVERRLGIEPDAAP